ncbi:MAG: ABC transporter ATP-binding protein, partial [Bacteroidales bacterium]
TCTVPEGFCFNANDQFYHPSVIRNRLEVGTFLSEHEVRTCFDAWQIPYKDLHCNALSLEDTFISLTGKY